jgi:hypothetical protein
MHEELKYVLEEAHMRVANSGKRPEIRKILNIVKSAKFVVWDDEAKLWVSPPGETECPDVGRCHGSMGWCDKCGDVATVCNDPMCMQEGHG